MMHDDKAEYYPYQDGLENTKVCHVLLIWWQLRTLGVLPTAIFQWRLGATGHGWVQRHAPDPPIISVASMHINWMLWYHKIRKWKCLPILNIAAYLNSNFKSNSSIIETEPRINCNHRFENSYLANTFIEDWTIYLGSIVMPLSNANKQY